MTYRPSDWSPVGLDVDPTPGDPQVVRTGGREYLDVAESIDDAAAAMARLDVHGTISQAVDALMDKKENTVQEIRKAHARYAATGHALVDYSSALERAQAATLAALERAWGAKSDADTATTTRDRLQDQVETATDPTEKAELQRDAHRAATNLANAHAAISSARNDIESAVADRDRAAEHAISRIEDITSHDDLNDSWWDNWGADLVAAIADIADIISTVAGILAVVVAFIPIVGTALAGALIVVAAVAAIVSALANIALAATGKRSWAEAGIAIAGAALSVIGLGGAAKAATGLSKAAFKAGFKQGLKGAGRKAWCKIGFGQCFVAGTLVRTADGDRAIEDIRAGDKVWARNLATGLDELHLVEETFVRRAEVLYHLTIDGQQVSTTAEHPFMVSGMGWIEAKDLERGDLLVTEDGTVTLDEIQVEEVDGEGVEVYNFHVHTHHNYYVVAGGLAILVHNAAGHSEVAQYSGRLIKVNKPDDAADLLARKINGESRVRFENDPDMREFDAVSDAHVAQSKPDNFTLNKKFRSQAKATFDAAAQSGRTPYFHFEGPPGPGVVEKIAEYGERYGLEPVIDISPLKG